MPVPDGFAVPPLTLAVHHLDVIKKDVGGTAILRPHVVEWCNANLRAEWELKRLNLRAKEETGISMLHWKAWCMVFTDDVDMILFKMMWY